MFSSINQKNASTQNMKIVGDSGPQSKYLLSYGYKKEGRIVLLPIIICKFNRRADVLHAIT